MLLSPFLVENAGQMKWSALYRKHPVTRIANGQHVASYMHDASEHVTKQQLCLSLSGKLGEKGNAVVAVD